MSKSTVVIGRPGSGKTAYLMDRVTEALEEGIPPSRIGMVSFTRAAVMVAAKRAAELMKHTGGGTDAKDFVNFKTLHAMAFSLLSLRKSRVMAGKHTEDFQALTGYNLSGIDVGEGTVANTIGSGSLYYHNLARARIETVARVMQEYPSRDVCPAQVREFGKAYTKFKASRGLMDFSDILEVAITENVTAPDLSVLLVDEAQDLSSLQWRFLDILSARADRVYYVGDSNQAIYSWAGADPDRFKLGPARQQSLIKGHRM
ncbi:MAG: UvrD-helicase domain-containing protein, partial [Bacteroidota bacterium]